uniref:Uncharacterized protein n=1 Tax=Spongospora subterranea TaxID=70186 RepID=A0A0H5RDZ0_9EUKA|eukprot:CRZ12460.1 hypothetical protein [Spongospora subterranea]
MMSLWNRGRLSRSETGSGGGAGDVNDAPFTNEIHLGDHHLQLIDGVWQLMNATPSSASNAVDDGLVAENNRLRVLVEDLEKNNHRLQFRNQILLAMCTISEGDRHVAELENEQLLRSRNADKRELGPNLA